MANFDNTGGNNSETLSACISCEPFAKFTTDSAEFIDKLSAAMIDPLWTIFLSFVGLWAITEGIAYLISGKGNYYKTLKDLFFLMIAGGLLAGNGNGLISEIFNVSISIMTGASSAVFDVVDNNKFDTGSKEGITRLIYAVEIAISDILVKGWALASSWTITNFAAILYALALCIPYFLMLIVYISQTTVSIFRLMLASALSPFLMLTFGFGWGRQMTIAGVKTVLSSIMVLFASTLAIALVIFIALNIDVDFQETNGPDGPLPFLPNSDVLLAIVLGWAGSALMTEAVGVANSITGSALSNTATGILTAGTTASLAAGAAAARKGVAAGAGEFMKAQAQGPGAYAQNKVQALRDKMNSMNGTATPKKDPVQELVELIREGKK